MTCHFPALGSASDWLKQISLAAQPIKSTSQVGVVPRHQYEISAPVPQTSFGGETSSWVVKCRPFLQAKFARAVFLCSYTTFLTKGRGEECYVKTKIILAAGIVE